MAGSRKAVKKDPDEQVPYDEPKTSDQALAKKDESGDAYDVKKAKKEYDRYHKNHEKLSGGRRRDRGGDAG